jgi:MFS family permease
MPDLLKGRLPPNLALPLGLMLFTGMMAAGYLYNVTFVQLGLVDLGTRLIDLDRTAVAGYMAVLAVLTCVTALLVGWAMIRRPGRRTLRFKLRAAFAAVALQAALTAVAPVLREPEQLLAWVVAASLALGLAVPVTFGLAVDLVPVRLRGHVAATITAIAYFAAAVLMPSWQVEALANRMLAVILPGAAGLGVLAFAPLPFVDEWSRHHQRPEFGRGRYVAVIESSARPVLRVAGIVALMFAVFFIDSLGFLRLTETPHLMATGWTATDLAPRLTIGVVHVLTALIGGVIYTNLGARHLFYWIFAIFALVHLVYVFQTWLTPLSGGTVAQPALYATAVSLYTVLTFALWADLSTPETIGRNTAVGVALSGWLATFLSTAVALRWAASEVPLEQHLRLVDALALVFLLLMLALTIWPSPRDRAAPELVEEKSG